MHGAGPGGARPELGLDSARSRIKTLFSTASSLAADPSPGPLRSRIPTVTCLELGRPPRVLSTRRHTNPLIEDLSRLATQTGIVKWFNDAKGFGFIKPDGGGEDLFAHFSQIEGKGFRSLAENQRVEFEVTQGQKGPQASRIRPI